MTDTEQQLNSEMMRIEGKILRTGQYISSVAESIPEEGIVKYSDGLVIDDPVAKADEIIKAAHEIKAAAIQYQALINLDDKIMETKKATSNPQDPTQVVTND